MRYSVIKKVREETVCLLAGKKEIRTKVKCVAIITFVKAFQLQTFFNRRYISAFFLARK